MGWNLEVAVVRTDRLTRAVPDLFGPTSTTMSFEDATSSDRGPDLCAARIGDWVVVVDVWCRLSEDAYYLAQRSASTDLHLAQISDEPITLHYRAGQQVMDARGLAACLQVTPCDYEDGETCAMQYLRDTTGVDWAGDDLWDAKFTLFVLD